MASTRRAVLRASSLLAAGPLPAASRKPTRSVYQELGIRPVINLRGPMTDIGASKVAPEIHEAMAEAARHYVVLDELQDRIGERLAKLIGTEDAMVTTGAAGAMAVGACACLTGADNRKVRSLPDLEGPRREAIIQKVHRNGYDHAIRATGMKIVEVENREQLERAINPHTAMLYYLGGTTGDWSYETPVKLDECLAVCKKAGVPVMVDAANMLPPWENIRKLAALGVDLICVSGGKHMRGPQCSGILAGPKSLIRAARLNMNPHSDSFGRPMKVGREEMIGVWLAAEQYAKLDFAALDKAALGQAEYLSRELKKIPGVETSFAPHDRTRRVHRLLVTWDEQKMGITTTECEKQLMDGDPRIAAARGPNGSLMFTLFMNEPGDEKIAVRRMREILRGRA